MLAVLLGCALAIPGAGGGLWQEWGPEALDQARRQGRPLVLLLGERACRSCREREAEALADPAVDERLRASFVAVRADRYDRPDLDDVFGTAATALGAARAYPLAVFLNPEGAPFAAQGGLGRDDAGDQPGLARLLLRRASDFARDPAGVSATAGQTLAALKRAQEASPAPAPGPEVGARLRDGLVKAAAPSLTGVLFLLDLDLESAAPGGDAAARGVALRALDDAAVAAGGRPPESLGETALLIEAHARAFSSGGAAGERDRAAALAAGALGELRDPSGGFRASRDPADDRVLAAPNGLMIGALAAAGEALARPDLLAAAREAAQRVLARLGPPARLAHGARGPTASGVAFLDDYAALALGLLALDEASQGREGELRQAAAALAEAAVGRFLDPQGRGFFLTGAGEGSLPVRPRTAFDGDAPSGNGLMALALQRLAKATGVASHAELACRTVEAFAGDLARSPRGMETLARAAAGCVTRAGAVEPGPVPLPDRATRGAVTVVASLAPAQVRAGGTCEVRLRLEIAPGWQVVAAGPGVKDLVGFDLNVVGPLAAGPPRGCQAKSVAGPFGTEPVQMYEGVCERVQPLRLRSPQEAPGERRVRLHVVFQACRALRCEPPQSVRLEVPLTVLPAP